MVMELYKKYRPKRFQDMFGNKQQLTSLASFLSSNSLPHSLLLSGPSGCGKTTVTRILKLKLKCSDTDFQEINAADFRGIDTIRDIRESMSLAPMCGETRIFMLDECAKLSSDAQTALLKLLEDTPQHVYFFLATTEPEKLISTIRNRCTSFVLQPLNDTDMSDLLVSVCKKENRTLPDKVIKDIIEMSCGSSRKALVLLEQVLSLDESQITEQLKVLEKDTSQIIDLCRALLDLDAHWNKISKILSTLEAEPENVRRAVLGYMSSVLLKSGSDRAAFIIDVFEEPFYNSGKPGLVNACFRVRVRK